MFPSIYLVHYYHYVLFTFRTSTQGLQCKMVSAKYSFSEAPKGYGGAEGLNKPTCVGDFKPIGKLCLTYPVNEAKTYSEAKAECLNQGSTLYGPIDAIQDAIMASRLEDWVSILV